MKDKYTNKYRIHYCINKHHRTSSNEFKIGKIIVFMKFALLMESKMYGGAIGKIFLNELIRESP